MTLWAPSGPTPTLHVIEVDVVAVTAQLTPPIITVLLAGSGSNPVPEMTMEVPRAMAPKTDYDSSDRCS